MRKTNMLAVVLLATFLVCSALSMAAAADDGDTSAVATATHSPDDSEDTPQSFPDNATQSREPIYEYENGQPAYHTLDNQTSSDGSQEAGAEENNLIAPLAKNDSDNSLLVIVGGAAFAVVLGCIIGAVYYRKQIKKE